MPKIIGACGVVFDNLLSKAKELSLTQVSAGELFISFDEFNKKNGHGFFFESEEFVFYFDGFIFDEISTNEKDFLIKAIGECCDINKVFSGIDGVYKAILYDKRKLKVSLIVDHLATRKLFYSYNSTGIVFSSNLFDIPNEGFTTEDLDLASIYFFLGFGFYETGKTLIKNIHQVEPGCIVEYDLHSRTVELVKYNTFKDVKKKDIAIENVLTQIHEHLCDNVKKIAAYNKKHGYELYSSLSGGLDAKTIVTMLRMFYPTSRINTLTFAQNGSSDHLISQEVSKELYTSHLYQSLDNGMHLYSFVNEYIYATSGMISCHGGLHTYNFYRKLNPKDIGLCFTGQIGDVVFGSAIDDTFDIKKDFDKISYSGKIPKFISEKIIKTTSIISKYKNESFEIFNLEQRQSGGTIYGDVCLSEMISTISPFYSKKLIELSLSIENSERIHEKLYIQWLKNYFPKVLSFKWDKCGCKPNSYNKVRIMKFLTSVKNSILRRIGFEYDNMNPMDKWIRENKKILSFLDGKYSENISLLKFDSELQDNVVKLYCTDADKFSRKKFAVVTLLMAINKLSGR